MATRQLIVLANMDILRQYGIAYQEGPRLSGNKLAADLEKGFEGEHELTQSDMHEYMKAKSDAEAQRAEARKSTRKRPSPPPEAHQRSPWKNFGL